MNNNTFWSIWWSILGILLVVAMLTFRSCNEENNKACNALIAQILEKGLDLKDFEVMGGHVRPAKDYIAFKIRQGSV